MDLYSSVASELHEKISLRNSCACFAAFGKYTILVLGEQQEEEMLRCLDLAASLKCPVLLLFSHESSFDKIVKKILELPVPVLAYDMDFAKIAVDKVLCNVVGECGKAEIVSVLEDLSSLSSVALLNRRRSKNVFGQSSGTGITIRQPVLTEVSSIHDFFTPFVEKKQILPRSEEEITENLDGFLVALQDERIIGTVALRDFGDGLFEVRSLTVASECEGRGIGSSLIAEVVEMARRRNASRIFTLTMKPRLFQRLGFETVSIMRFPCKVQNDCLNCPKKEQCDEVALVKYLVASGTGRIISGS